jgi:hypothetical protein
MSIPAKVRLAVRERVWSLAKEVDWPTLPDSARSRKYEEWTRDPEIGGLLGNYVDPKQVRVYIKDSVIKPYVIALRSDQARTFRALDIPHDALMAEGYLKPHGRRLEDGRVVCWGQARDWKLVLLAVWERAYENPSATPYGAVLNSATGQWAADAFRAKALDLAQRLGVRHLIWLDA